MNNKILSTLILGGILLVSSPMDNGPVIVDGNYDMLANHDAQCADLKQALKKCPLILENCKKWAKNPTELTWCYNSDHQACEQYAADYALNCNK